MGNRPQVLFYFELGCPSLLLLQLLTFQGLHIAVLCNKSRFYSYI